MIITNIGESHLQDLGSREGIAEAKLEIVNGLQENGLVIYYGDEPLLDEKLKSYSGSAALRTFGRTGKNDVYPMDIEQNDSGSTFGINVSSGKFYLPVLGTHNVLNALAAMIAASHFGVPYEKMNEGFASLKLTNMRMELLEGQSGEKIINDAYNASPTSMNAAIELIANLPGYKRKFLFSAICWSLVRRRRISIIPQVNLWILKRLIMYLLTASLANISPRERRRYCLTNGWPPLLTNSR